MRRVLLIGILLAVGVAGIVAQQPAGGPPQVAELVKLRDNLFVVKGGGGNTAAFVTSTGVESVIPGHADVMPWAKFVEFGDFNAAFLAAVQQAVKDGKTPEEAFAALKLPEKFKDYQIGPGQANVTAIYAELKK